MLGDSPADERREHRVGGPSLTRTTAFCPLFFDVPSRYPVQSGPAMVASATPEPFDPVAPPARLRGGVSERLAGRHLGRHAAGDRHSARAGQWRPALHPLVGVVQQGVGVAGGGHPLPGHHPDPGRAPGAGQCSRSQDRDAVHRARHPAGHPVRRPAGLRHRRPTHQPTGSTPIAARRSRPASPSAAARVAYTGLRPRGADSTSPNRPSPPGCSRRRCWAVSWSPS